MTMFLLYTTKEGRFTRNRCFMLYAYQINIPIEEIGKGSVYRAFPKYNQDGRLISFLSYYIFKCNNNSFPYIGPVFYLTF